MSTVYVAFSTIAVDNFENYLTEPRAPSNYKDQHKIAEYIASARHKQIEEASQRPMTSKLAQIKFATQHSGELAVFSLKRDETVAEVLDGHSVISCIDASTLMRLARFDLIEKKGTIDEGYRWLVLPELVAGRKPFVFDPISKLLGSDAAENTDPWVVAKRFLGIDDMYFDKNYTGIDGKVRLTRALSKLLGV